MQQSFDPSAVGLSVFDRLGVRLMLSASLSLCLSFLIVFFLKLFLKRFYLFLFRQRRREGEREGEKYQCVIANHMPLTGDLASNPGMCPDWESNQWPFGSQVGAQSTEPHQPGPSTFLKDAWVLTLTILWSNTMLYSWLLSFYYMYCSHIFWN